MGIKVKAIERNVNFGKNNDENWMYVMQPELYGQLTQDKVIAQAALNSGMPKPAMQAAVNAYGEVVKAWATEGHSIPIPGLGTMRFGVRSNAVDDVTKVKASLITSRRVIFTPNSSMKKELAETPVTITCYDRNGKIVKTVDSSDKDNVEDPDTENSSKDNSPSKGDNTGSGSQTGTEGDGSQGGGSSTTDPDKDSGDGPTPLE